jgi:hypothetical protein
MSRAIPLLPLKALGGLLKGVLYLYIHTYMHTYPVATKYSWNHFISAKYTTVQ